MATETESRSKDDGAIMMEYLLLLAVVVIPLMVIPYSLVGMIGRFYEQVVSAVCSPFP